VRGEERRVQGFGRKTEGKVPLGKPRHIVRIILKCIFRK
jgi:hypothetical protein